MTAKFDKFKEALIALCEEHNVVLAYDFSEEVHVKDRCAIKSDDHTFCQLINVEDILWDAINKNT